MSFTFIAEVESPRPFYKWHTVRCEGDWAESDGDAIRPGFRFFNPERVWVIRNSNHSRLIRDIPQWLWDALSYKGEDEYRAEKEDADAERYEAFRDDYQCFDMQEEDPVF